MFFTNNELTAITRMALFVSEADGKQRQKETDAIVYELQRCGIPHESCPIIIVNALSMSFHEAVQIIRPIDTERKKYITAFLGILACVDGEIDKTEMDMWSQISFECNLPAMTLQEAYQIMKSL